MQVGAIKRKNLWFSISGSLILASLVCILISFAKLGTPLKLGIDFTGGTKLEYKFSSELASKLNSETVQTLLSEIGLHNANAMVSQSAEPVLILKTQAISDDPILETLQAKLQENFGEFQVLAIDTVSPLIGPELLSSGLIALLLTVIGIILYVSNRFKRDYAICAIIALFHDVFIVTGLFAFLGIYKGIEVDSLFITALLTVFGFSIHDTIVVFDRIRENQKLQNKNFSFDQVAEQSVNQVAVRSVNTSTTSLITLAFLYFLGGATTKIFAGAMFVGMLVGTYSSIFIASPLLVLMRRKAN